jgi:hypothetical protein
MNFLLQTFVVFSSFTLPPDSVALTHEQEVRAWHERRLTNLRRDYGWLTLVALDWLKEGSNEIRGIGSVFLTHGVAMFQAKTNVEAFVAGNLFLSGPLTPQGEQTADTVKIGTKAFIIIRRADRLAVRMWDKDSKRRREFDGVQRYPVSDKWRIEARWQQYEPPKQIKVPTITPGYVEDYPVPGAAIFTIEDKEYRLEPVLEEPNGDYFFIFGDKTNGKETYGAGRFLYSKPAVNGTVILDFNKSYNPPCAFTEYATCPLPPTGNKLPIRVEAGETKYGPH